MPAPFIRLDLEQFAALLERYPFTRAVREVHVHHTVSPRHSDRVDEKTMEAMGAHARSLGWSDVAQHLAIGLDGHVWTGRDWNRPPISARGFNGDERAGPFMFEMIGDFDTGGDPLDGAQLGSAAEVIARVQLRFGLPAGAFRFHRDLNAARSCPGEAVTRDELLKAVEAARERVRDEISRAVPLDLPFDSSAKADDPANDAAVNAALDSLTAAVPEAAMDAERHCDHLDGEEAGGRGAAPAGEAGARGGRPFTPEARRRLRPHVVNLTMGRLSSDGVMRTGEDDVRAIFAEHLPAFLRRHPGGKIVFYAHGGLVGEEDGLWMAHDQVDWWMANGVYPVYFVWETGLLQTLRQLFRGSAPDEAARGVVDERITDSLVERVARGLGGPKIWGGMKLSAELASREGGGARLAAECLAELLRTEVAAGVEVHAVGHSAGAIFHSHFIPAALEAGVERFASLSLLAPAIRVDAFLERLEPRVGPGRGVERLAMFTMADDYERADRCAGVYRKSLLYLIHHALEAAPGEAVLGLEVSVRAEARLRALFGLEGAGTARGEVFWSVTDAASGRSATRSATHGGFDNDAPTMESVLRRVLGRDGAGEVVPFPRQVERAPEKIPAKEPVRPDPAPLVVPGVTSLNRGGRRRALCVGINAYPGRHELFGCVGDAELWAKTLRGQGFEVTMLRDAEATREGILRELERLVKGGEPGDVLAFQYAGHGVQLPDLDGDEVESGKDQALVPIDFESGAYVLDDEQFGIFGGLREEVNLTCFYDCCHSGTMARLMESFRMGMRGMEDALPRIRCLEPTAEMVAAFREHRARLGGARGLREKERSRAVAFSACRDDQPAMERGGHGVFTLAATSLLAGLGGERPTHEEFHRRVEERLSGESQRPQLDCRREAAGLRLLEPLGAAAGRDAPPAPARDAGLWVRTHQLHALRRQIDELLNGGAGR